jgi:hypothetical protein
MAHQFRKIEPADHGIGDGMALGNKNVIRWPVAQSFERRVGTVLGPEVMPRPFGIGKRGGVGAPAQRVEILEFFDVAGTVQGAGQ